MRPPGWGREARQVQVPVERIEAAVIRHFTSRTGDPHRHLHLQVNARIWAVGSWRAGAATFGAGAFGSMSGGGSGDSADSGTLAVGISTSS